MTVISDLLDRCDLVVLHETLLGDDDKVLLDRLNLQFDNACVPSVRKSDTFVERSMGGLPNLLKIFCEVNIEPLQVSYRIMALKLTMGSPVYMLINVYSKFDYVTVEVFLCNQSSLADLSKICNSEVFDGVIIMGLFNAGSPKGRFFELSEAQACHLIISRI